MDNVTRHGFSKLEDACIAENCSFSSGAIKKAGSE